ncbi:MAG: antitoxin VapB family protein [Candidatus Bathyarchaeia archaeon]|nr:antitoxin VapB family protein [Candidatus Bathyarchaeota archaeon]
MAHKTITISEEAYRALAGLKEKNESFTDVILRITRRRGEENLLDYIRSQKPDEEFAEILKKIVKERREILLPTPTF